MLKSTVTEPENTVLQEAPITTQPRDIPLLEVINGEPQPCSSGLQKKIEVHQPATDNSDNDE